MRGAITIISFIFLGLLTAFYIGFGIEDRSETIAIDYELEGLNEKYILKFSHVVAENTPKGMAANKLAELVYEKTDGWVEIQVYPNGMLYEAQEEFPALLQNEVHIIAPAFSEITVHDPKWYVMDLPFLFDDLHQVQKAFDGRIGELLFNSIEQHGYQPLAIWDNSFKQWTNNIRPIVTPSDMEGLTMRLMPSQLLINSYRMLGVTPYKSEFNDVYDLLSSKTIDGTENTLSNIFSKGFYNHQKFMTISNHNYLGYAVLMNPKFLNSLPYEYQKSIIEAMDEVTKWLRKYALQVDREILGDIIERGQVDVYYLSDREKELWKEKLNPIYEQYEPIIGEEIMREVSKLKE